jgi:hypothetical protein
MTQGPGLTKSRLHRKEYTGYVSPVRPEFRTNDEPEAVVVNMVDVIKHHPPYPSSPSTSEDPYGLSCAGLGYRAD